MRPSDIVDRVIQDKISSCPGIKGFSLEPAGVPGHAPILVFEVQELTPSLAQAIFSSYRECRREVALTGYRVGSLLSHLELG